MSEVQENSMPQISPTTVYSAPSVTPSSYIMQLTDFEPEINDFILRLQGYFKVNNNGMVEYIKMQGHCNKEGAYKIGSMVYAIVTDITALSGLEDKEIKTMVWDFMQSVIKDLGHHSDEYGILTDVDRDVILSMCYHFVFPLVSRSHVERINDKKFFRNITQEQTQKVDVVNATKTSGFFDKLKGRF